MLPLVYLDVPVVDGHHVVVFFEGLHQVAPAVPELREACGSAFGDQERKRCGSRSPLRGARHGNIRFKGKGNRTSLGSERRQVIPDCRCCELPVSALSWEGPHGCKAAGKPSRGRSSESTTEPSPYHAPAASAACSACAPAKRLTACGTWCRCTRGGREG